MKINTEKLAKILFALFIMVFSITVLAVKIPKTEYVQETLAYLEDTQQTIMTFSGATLATSLAMSALPDDFASPLANTVTDLNKYFIFMFAVIFIEKLIVVEGSKIALAYIIPIACGLYVLSILTTKEMFKTLGTKLLILGVSLVLVIPFSTHFTETVCEDYLIYVDETIAEANHNADTINGVIAIEEENANLFDKLSNAFKGVLNGASNLVNYFKNFIKKCVNSIAIMLVTTFALPIAILLMFRWLLKELFALNISVPKIQLRLPNKSGDNLPNGIETTKEEEIE